MPNSQDPLAQARARASELRAELLEEAGGTWTAREVATHLGVGPETVEARRRRGALLAVEVGRAFVYPRCQFGDTSALEGLEQVLGAIETESPWVRLSVLLSPTLRKGLGVLPTEDREVSVIGALRAGRVGEAIHAARSWGKPGFS